MENIQIFCSLYPLFGGRNVCKHADYSFLTHRFPAFFGCYVLFEYFCIRNLAIAGNKGMTETLIVSTLIVGVAMLGLCVKLIVKPGSSFTSMHIHDSEAMRQRGIHCVIDQDREARESKVNN